MLAIIATAVLPVTVFAQGIVNFDTIVLGPTAQVSDVNGVLCWGTNFLAQLYAAKGTAAEGALVAMGSPVNFRTGFAAGYVRTASPAVPSVFVFTGGTAGGPATVQMRAWSSAYATYETAEAGFLAGSADAHFGRSATLFLASTGIPPATPPNLTGLRGFQLVPEPSTLALVLLGVAAPLICRRK